MDRMIRLDDRDPQRIERVLRWLYRGNDKIALFWAPNVRSPVKLRAKWDQIREQYESSRATPSKSNAGIDAVARRLEGLS